MRRLHKAHESLEIRPHTLVGPNMGVTSTSHLRTVAVFLGCAGAGRGSSRVAGLDILTGDWGVTRIWERAVSRVGGALSGRCEGCCNGLPVLRSKRV